METTLFIQTVQQFICVTPHSTLAMYICISNIFSANISVLFPYSLNIVLLFLVRDLNQLRRTIHSQHDYEIKAREFATNKFNSALNSTSHLHQSTSYSRLVRIRN